MHAHTHTHLVKHVAVHLSLTVVGLVLVQVTGLSTSGSMSPWAVPGTAATVGTVTMEISTRGAGIGPSALLRAESLLVLVPATTMNVHV